MNIKSVRGLCDVVLGMLLGNAFFSEASFRGELCLPPTLQHFDYPAESCRNEFCLSRMLQQSFCGFGTFTCSLLLRFATDLGLRWFRRSLLVL